MLNIYLPQRSSFGNLDSDKDFLRISASAPDIASEYSPSIPKLRKRELQSNDKHLYMGRINPDLQ